ncbi:FAD-dependent tricarballylate dehydrogenase TcuA [Thioalkalicoccus limnaeus]|uniref:FAD-dependent tricarballylate dehydrogenase TcuA n=1 Tax=Thioalkalicoccus limnaeus TaxID=120681 RepID=A0ABV4BGA1_9GAMM
MADRPRPGDPPPSTEILVVGGGIAAYCAALAARQAGAAVTLIDRAPPALRGGNARHSRNLRLAHAAPSRLSPGCYRPDEFVADLARASHGLGDLDLARRLADGSTELPDWLERQGVRFEEPAAGALPYSRKTAFFLGGGKAMINALSRRAAALGVAAHQDTMALRVGLDSARPYRLPLCIGERSTTIDARAVILACGGYQANPAWLAETWGAAADNFIVRGLPQVTGELLRDLFEHGAASTGVPGACHLVAVDARSPPADGGIVTRIDGLSWGLVLDRDGRRFLDEAAELSPRRYSVWGRQLARCPGGIAFLILDAEGQTRTTPSLYPPITAPTLAELAQTLDLPVAAVERTVSDYHGARHPDDRDGGHTEGLDPPKSRRARPLCRPPFAAWPMAPGITFTSHGIQVDTAARVMRRDGRPFPSLFAAGMIMAPAILGTGYLAGAALTIGAVFGRLAGEQAARDVRTRH